MNQENDLGQYTTQQILKGLVYEGMAFSKNKITLDQLEEYENKAISEIERRISCKS